ncbi:MAG: hypothetical protein A2452_04195 [Candidatus Firestonebacteria bacterium RIFOXYC2_FULL_39_67]|nr:MAG: hypothetical protein A2536_08265 [Candidatus Firestonebacteria bacterium RIFOXYD2_FULL_39_29]OGF56249.1 MAG: hypothetical protein A2497_06295 [Candidatus Firestonebacteria bacterium RifOxyC12_full_39_7]OGF57571.1 MAG: hypothetical protein A2452_04195 [Candidatus Firestonebacteria bacterium RIFOXYC2_FULL_39_67]
MMLFVFFFLGLFTAIAQVIITREYFVVFFGQELAIGFILAGWLLWLSLGSFFYSKVVSKIKNQLFWFSLLVSVLPFLLLIEIIAIRNLRALFVVPSYMLFSLPVMILSVFLVQGPFCFLTGLLFPLGLDIDNKKNKFTVLDLYLIAALGSLAAGLIFTFIYIPYSNHFTAAYFSAAVLFVCLLFFVKLLKLKRYFIYIYFSGLVLSLYFTAGSGALDSYYNLQRWKTFSNGIELLNNRDSNYQNIAIGVRDGQYSVFENGRISVSFPDDYADAQFIHPVMMQHKRPKNVLYFGLPANAIIREMAHYNVETVEFVQPDPLIASMLTSLQNLHDIKKTALINDEARHYLENTRKKYDLIVCSLSAPSTAFIGRYYTKEFFEEVKASLLPDGVFVSKISSFGEEIPGYDAAAYFTLKSVFPHCLVSAGDVKYLFASNGAYISMNADELKERYKNKRINSEYFNRYVFKTIFEKDRILEFVKELEERKEKIINSDYEAGGYYLNIKYWMNLTSVRLPGVMKVLFEPWVIFLLLSIVFVLFYRRRLKLSLRVNISALVSGFSGSFLFVLIVLAFQSLKGSLYGYLGLFSGLFMFGLFAGVFTSRKSKNINPAKLALAQGAFVLASIGVIVINYFFRGAVSLIPVIGMFMLCFLSGFVTGFMLPFLVKLHHLPGMKVSYSASIIYAFANLGAALGAAIGAAFIIPIAGFIESAILVIFINLLCGILIVKQS